MPTAAVKRVKPEPNLMLDVKTFAQSTQKRPVANWTKRLMSAMAVTEKVVVTYVANFIRQSMHTTVILKIL